MTTKGIFRFRPLYLFVTIFLFITEVVIALYIKDKFIRPYVGDFLVVILLYTFVRSFLDANKTAIAIAVLFFSFSIEFLQYLNLLDVLGLRRNRLANIVLGNYFTWHDILSYTLGIGFVLLVEYLVEKSRPFPAAQD